MSLFNFTGNNNLTLKNIVDGKKRSLVNVFGLVQSKLLQLKENYDIGVSFQLEAVRLSYSLLSMDKAPFPDIKFADNLATKMAKIADIQADFPSIQLNIYHKKANFNKTDLIAVIPIQNKGIVGYADLLKPYLTTGDVKLLGEEDELLVSVNLNGQNIGSDDWLQIEIDYTCVISGVYKPQEVEKINNGYYKLFNIPGGIPLIRDDGYIDAALIPPQASNNLNVDLSVHTALSFIDANLFTFLGGVRLYCLVPNENNQRLPFYQYLMDSLSHHAVQFREGITSLDGFNPNIANFRELWLDSVGSLIDSELNRINRFVNLRLLRLRHTKRDTVDYAGIIGGCKIDYLDCYSCSLPTSKMDEIIIAIDNSNINNGYLDLRLNEPPTPGLVALNNIAAKGWNYFIE